EVRGPRQVRAELASAVSCFPDRHNGVRGVPRQRQVGKTAIHLALVMVESVASHERRSPYRFSVLLAMIRQQISDRLATLPGRKRQSRMILAIPYKTSEDSQTSEVWLATDRPKLTHRMCGFGTLSSSDVLSNLTVSAGNKQPGHPKASHLAPGIAQGNVE